MNLTRPVGEHISTETFPANSNEHLTHARAHAVHIPLGGIDAAGGIGSVGGGGVDAPQPTNVPCHGFVVRFVDALIDCASRDLDLVRLSLTVPRERETDLVRLMHEFAAEVAGAGKGHGAWLVFDLREKTLAPHVYGVVLVSQATKAALVQRWCAKTGADPNAHRGRSVLVSVQGWAKYATNGNARRLRQNLLRPGGPGYGVVTYGLKPLPNGEERDLDGEHVAVSGVLARPWRRSRPSGAPSGPPDPRARLAPMGVGVPRRACVVCQDDIPAKKRWDAETCSAPCRMRRRDRRKPSPKQGTPTTGGQVAKHSRAERLLSVVRELLSTHRRTPFTSDQAYAVGARLGVGHAEVRALLRELRADGAVLAGPSARYVFAPPRTP